MGKYHFDGLVPKEGREEALAAALPCFCGNKPEWRDMTKKKTKRDAEYTLFGCFGSDVHDGVTVVGRSIDTPRRVVEIWNSLVIHRQEECEQQRQQ